MDNKQKFVCELCNIIFNSNKSKEEHLHGKKHLLAMHQANTVKTKEQSGIFVTGLPNIPEEELVKFFGEYGKIISHYYKDNQYLIVQFDGSEPVETLLKLGTVSCKGKLMKISRRSVREREAAKAVYTSPTQNYDHILGRLKMLTTFEEQLKYVIWEIQPSHENVKNNIYYLMNDLEKALKQQFASVNIHIFGSIVTHLYMTYSDLDIYVEVLNSVGHKSSDPSLASTYVNKSKAILYKYGNVFSSICAIPNAKTPIVKFVHSPTSIKCDMNFKNMLGVFNSQLIQYYLLRDYKLTLLMLFIKFWAKVHELTGLGGKFSNYALALMFIFYLQQPGYNLPPVTVLQTPNWTNIQDGWNGGFQRIETYSRLLTEQHIVTILRGFFEYYANFDYTLNIICPYLGKVIPKTDFLELNSLPALFHNYKKNISEGKLPLKIDSPICVQDPFELNHNVAVGVNTDYLEEFTSLCKTAFTIMQNETDLKDAMFKMLTEEAEVVLGKVVANDKECRFKIPLSSTLIQVNDIVTLKSEATCTQKHSETIRIWQDELKVTLLEFLKNIMKFTITFENDSKPDEKAQRRCGQKDIHDIINSQFICCGFYNLWDGHRRVLKDINIDKTLPLMEQQFIITKHVLDVMYKGAVLTEKIIEFNILVNFKDTPAEATFHLKNIRSRQGYFKKFAIYFLRMLPVLFHAHLLEVLKTLKETEKQCSEEKLV